MSKNKTAPQISYTGYESLAAAIVSSAIEDYIACLVCREEKPSLQDKHGDAQITRIEKFFKSEYFSILSDINPSILMSKCKEYAKKKIRYIPYNEKG